MHNIEDSTDSMLVTHPPLSIRKEVEAFLIPWVILVDLDQSIMDRRGGLIYRMGSSVPIVKVVLDGTQTHSSIENLDVVFPTIRGILHLLVEVPDKSVFLVYHDVDETRHCP
jgi:hypothetical protein